MTNADLQPLLAKWQKILRLQDWHVIIEFVRSYDLDADAQGRCSWKLAKKAAIIRLMSPLDADPSWTIPQDVEKTIVHELLHLHVAPFDDTKVGTMEYFAMEQMVEILANAFVDMDRRQGLKQGESA